MNPFRIVVVDDSALFRTLLRNVVAEIPGCEVAASVGDGRKAIDKIRELKPDLVTLDVEMPDMNGIEVLRELRRQGVDVKVVMVSRYTTSGAQVTTDALIEGAFDFILKPSGTNPTENKAVLRDALAERISALRGDSSEVDDDTAVAAPVPHQRRSAASKFDAVIIGCSTGGPDALARVIPDLPADLPAPVFVVQHMPEGFTATLAARLDEASELQVLEAADGLRVRVGQVILARGGLHLKIVRRTGGIEIRLTEDPPEHRCRPAVDYTLRSAVETFDHQLLVVILTGMGRDGTEGGKLAHAQGGHIIAQHADGCTVYGMPKYVVQSGIADEIVKLPHVAAAISQILKGRSY